MNLLLKCINWRYPRVNATSKVGIWAGDIITVKPKIIIGIYFIGIRHGKQNKVVCWSGVWDAWNHITIITIGKNPNENKLNYSGSTENKLKMIIPISVSTKFINKFWIIVSIRI